MPAYIPPSRRHNFMLARPRPAQGRSLGKSDFPPLVEIQERCKEAPAGVPAYADVATGGRDSTNDEKLNESEDRTGYVVLSADRATGHVRRDDLSTGSGPWLGRPATTYLQYLQTKRDLDTELLGLHSKFWEHPHLLDASEAEDDKERADAEWSATLQHLEE